MDQPEGQRLTIDGSEDRGSTRRDALRTSLAAGGVVLSAGALAACGSGSSSPGASTAPTAPTTGKYGGTLHIAIIGSTADTVDAHVGTGTTGTSGNYAMQLYDAPTRFNHAYGVELSMAEELTVAPDAMSWTLRLKQGLEFHNGKTVDADDAIFSIRRMADLKLGSSDAIQFAAVDTNRLQKLDNRTVRINLLYPDISIADGFAKYASGIVPVDYDPKKPVGSGPFKLVSFSPLVKTEFTRFENFWRTDASGKRLPYLDGVTFVTFTDDVAIGNAIASNAVDAGAGLAPAQLDIARGNPEMNVVVPQGYGYTVITMRVDKPPFTDNRVRTAMKLMLDRHQFVKSVYAGYAIVGNDIPSFQDPVYNHSIPQRLQDLEQAKSLLKAAGQTNLTETIYAYPSTAYIEPQATVFAQQAKAVGANINVQVTSASEFFAKDFALVTLATDFYFTATMWEAIDYEWYYGAPYNETHWDDPHFDMLVRQSRGSVDVSKRKQYATDFQLIMRNEGGVILTAFEGYPCCLSKKFTGLVNDVANLGLNGGQLFTISQT